MHIMYNITESFYGLIFFLCLFLMSVSVKNLNSTLSALQNKITQVEALGEKAPPSANMTESIRKIKDVIEETRNYVNRVKYSFKTGVSCLPPLIKASIIHIFILTVDQITTCT